MIEPYISGTWTFSRPLCEGVDWNIPFRKCFYGTSASPSLRGRGLKLLREILEFLKGVALFTRAWIEIVYDYLFCNQHNSRPLYEGVDWNRVQSHPTVSGHRSPSLRGRGLKYRMLSICSILQLSPSLRGRGLKFVINDAVPYHNRRPLYEGVDWNGLAALITGLSAGRPLYEGVDWNPKGNRFG